MILWFSFILRFCTSFAYGGICRTSFAALNYVSVHFVFVYIIIVISSIMVVFPVYTSLFWRVQFCVGPVMPVKAINILYVQFGVWARVLTMAANYWLPGPSLKHGFLLDLIPILIFLFNLILWELWDAFRLQCSSVHFFFFLFLLISCSSLKTYMLKIDS